MGTENEKDLAYIRKMNSETIVKIKGQLQSIQRTMLGLKKSGIHRDILIAYLKDRTGMGKNDIASILEAQDEFYQKLVKLTEA